jgi:hypothetical protein
MFDFALFLLYLYEAAAVHVQVFFLVRDVGAWLQCLWLPLSAGGGELHCLWLPLSAPFPSRVEAHPPLPHISEAFLLTWPQAALMSAHSRHGTNLHHQHARLQLTRKRM